MSTIRSFLAGAVLAALLAGCGRATPATPIPSRTAVAQASPTRPTAGAVATRAATPAPSPLPATRTPAAPASPAPTLDPDVLATMDEIAAEVEVIRELPATQPITRTIVTRQEVAQYLADEFEKEYTPAEEARDVRVLAAFDLVPEDFDLRAANLALYSAQIVGLYDDEANVLKVVSEAGLDLEARITLAHEYTHALQDEHFRLDTFQDEDRLNDDELLARQSLIEGDATAAEAQWLAIHLSEISEEELQALQSGGDSAAQEALDNAPPILRETLLFPYLTGYRFVATLQENGWDAVDAAYADPPRSTEQILHPEKYLSGDEPQIVAVPPLTGTLGAGWKLIDAETVGEFATQIFLAQQMDRETANAAAAGWDGDGYALYAREDQEVLVWDTVWDTAADREEFASAYAAYARSKYGQDGTAGGDSLRWETPGQTAYLAWDGKRAWVVLGPDRETVDRVAGVVER